MPDEDELIPTEESLPTPTVQRFNLIYDLIQQVTSIAVVSRFLKFRQLRHSAGSWEELRDKRLLPPLRAGKFTLDDLSNFLNECEEYGRNHTFLYQTQSGNASALMDPARLGTVCAQMGRSVALSGVEVENMPSEPTLTQVRQEDEDGHRTVTFKIIQTRREREFLGEYMEGDDILVRRWTHRNVRAVNVARLHASGLLEVRIRSHTSSTKYDTDLKAIWLMLKDFLPPTQFRPFGLGKAKKKSLGAPGIA